MNNVSTSGVTIYLLANKTLPIGINITSLADDVDPLQFGEVSIGEVQIDLNGKPVSISQGVAIPVSISVIPGSANDSSLSVLWNANRACHYSAPAKDDITLLLRFPDRTTKIFSSGSIVSGPASFGATTSGKAKTATYGFAFGDVANLSAAAAFSAVSSFIFS